MEPGNLEPGLYGMGGGIFAGYQPCFRLGGNPRGTEDPDGSKLRPALLGNLHHRLPARRNPSPVLERPPAFAPQKGMTGQVGTVLALPGKYCKIVTR